MKTRIIPFDIEKARNGAKVVTRAGFPVRIGFFDLKSDSYPIPIVGAIEKDGREDILYFTKEGRLFDYREDDCDLFIEEEVEVEEDEIKKELIDAINGLWNNDALPMPLTEKLKDSWIAWIEEQGEPEPSNVIKPKFKVGDWVVDNQGIFRQITSVQVQNEQNEYGYYAYGYIDDGHYFNDRSDIRFWSVKYDAKDGDVLAIDTGAFIYAHRKQLYDNDIAVAHCFVNEVIGRFYLGGEFGYSEGGNSIYPATKEQRDLLFKKMKEAGYEWDEKEKELKELKEVKTRRMTNQELAWWLRDKPEEHREYCYTTAESDIEFEHVYSEYEYIVNCADKKVKGILIRRNGGEWEEPLIEVK